MTYEIIDFHTHPFPEAAANINSYKDHGTEDQESYLRSLGISAICGSVIYRLAPGDDPWETILACNNGALALQKQLGSFYIPGFHVHPDFVKESCDEILRMHNSGVRLIGELVPYLHGWSDYSLSAFDEILDAAEQYNMIVSFHSMDNDQMDTMVRRHPKTVFVATHPGEYPDYMRHLERMKFSENYYLDLSGYGLFRHRMLRYGIDTMGIHRFLFGSDYPTCSPAMYIGGVALDPLLTDAEKQQIFSGNAKRLLGLE